MCRVLVVNCPAFILAYFSTIVNLSGVLSQTESPVTCQYENTDELPKIYPISPTQTHHLDSMLDDEPSANTSNSPSKFTWSKLYDNCLVQAEFVCNASYPVEWVEHYDQSIGNLTEIMRLNIKKDLWTERSIRNETLLKYTNLSFSSYTDPLLNLPHSLTTYTAFLGIKYKQKVCAAANYTCQSVRKPCLQSSLISAVDQQRETIGYYYQHSEGYSDRNDQNRECGSQIKMAINENGMAAWRCVGTKEYPELTARISDCDSASQCNTFFRHLNQQNCVRRLQSMDECSGCEFRKISGGFLFFPGYLYCIDKTMKVVVSAHQFFYSVSQTLNATAVPELYLNWEEANPQKMLYLEPLSKPIFVGETRTMFCKISRFYFSYGYRFGFEYLNGTMRYTECRDGTQDFIHNVNTINVTFTFSDVELRRIFCFAPVWNSTKWVNQSMVVNLRTDGIAPSFESDIRTSSVSLTLHQRNATLPCKANGQPTPQIEWVFDSKDAGIVPVEGELGRKDLSFQYVSHSVAGKYQCNAYNFLGTVTKTFHVGVKDELAGIKNKNKLWESIILAAAVFLSIFVVALGMCWRKVRRQRAQIRALTDEEVREFRNGNADILGNSQYLDTQELLQAIPYNDDYEIPSKRLHIDHSEVLGSGNFGRVLKGVMYNGNDKNGTVVAVKTTKEKYDVTFFQTLLTEVKIMAYLGRHTNVVSLMGACTENIQNRQIFIAVEFCAKGSLERLLKNNRSSFKNLVYDDTICITTSFGENDRNHRYYENSNSSTSEFSTIDLLRWSREIANGMDFLGSKKIVHGDLAVRNILLTEDLVAKIGDFGLSRVIMTYSNYIRSTQDDCLLPWKWMAFETLEEMKFSAKSDVWSYGVTLWEIFSLAQHPYPGESYTVGFLDWLKNGHRLHKPFYANGQIYNLMMECWSIHSSERPTFTEIKDLFEGLLLQTCDIEYIRTKCGPTQYMNNLSPNHRPQNPGYLVLGQGNFPVNKEYDVRITPSDRSSFPIISASEDCQGYLKPLMTEFGYNVNA